MEMSAVEMSAVEAATVAVEAARTRAAVATETAFTAAGPQPLDPGWEPIYVNAEVDPRQGLTQPSWQSSAAPPLRRASPSSHAGARPGAYVPPTPCWLPGGCPRNVDMPETPTPMPEPPTPTPGLTP